MVVVVLDVGTAELGVDVVEALLEDCKDVVLVDVADELLLEAFEEVVLVDVADETLLED